MLDIDYTDRSAERREQSLQKRLDTIFEQMQDTEDRLDCIRERIEHAEQKESAKESIYSFLEHFQDFYDDMEDVDKKALLCAIIDSVELYPKTKQSGQWIKTVHFSFPMLYHGEEIVSISFSPNESHEETIVVLGGKKDRLKISVDTADLEASGKTYTNDDIKDYIEQKYGYKVTSAYIGQVKAKLGIRQHENYRPAAEGGRKPCVCPKEKEEAIIEALKHFKFI